MFTLFVELQLKCILIIWSSYTSFISSLKIKLDRNKAEAEQDICNLAYLIKLMKPMHNVHTSVTNNLFEHFIELLLNESCNPKKKNIKTSNILWIDTSKY